MSCTHVTFPIHHSSSANVTYNQAVQTVTAYINARPQRIQERFIDLATEALHDAWPCKPK